MLVNPPPSNHSSQSQNAHLRTFFVGLPPPLFRIIGGILATDNALHFELVKKLRQRISEHQLLNSAGEAIPEELAVATRTSTVSKRSSTGSTSAPPSDAGSTETTPPQGGRRKSNSKRRASSFFLHAAQSHACPLSKSNAEDRALLVDSMIHLADLSNPVVPFRISEKWADLIVAEYYDQHLAEKKLGLPSQPFMTKHPDDRGAKAQLEVNFIDFVVMPIWTVMSEFFVGLKGRVSELKVNRQLWVDMKAEEEGKEETGRQEGKMATALEDADGESEESGGE